MKKPYCLFNIEDEVIFPEKLNNFLVNQNFNSIKIDLQKKNPPYFIQKDTHKIPEILIYDII